MRCSSHAWDQGGSAPGHAGGTLTLEGSLKSVKDVRPASFFKTSLIVTIPPFTLHYGPQTLLHHADVFQPRGGLGNLKRRMRSSTVNNFHPNISSDTNCLGLVPFGGIKLATYQAAAQQIYAADTYGWPVDLYVGS